MGGSRVSGARPVRLGELARGALRWLLPPKGASLERLELELARGLIGQALERTDGNVSQAAKLPGLLRRKRTASRAYRKTKPR